ncbi:hypothetical protein CBL_02904 [Carabus blaptoides fortunei]
MTSFASIEATCKKGTPFINEMELAIGLSKDKIRYRGSKPEYKKFLEIAIRERQEKAQETYSRAQFSAPQLAAPSTTTGRASGRRISPHLLAMSNLYTQARLETQSIPSRPHLPGTESPSGSHRR